MARYEYKTISIRDNRSGASDLDTINRTLNSYAAAGWHVVASFTNEIGVNSSSNTFGGYTTSTNATIDETVFVLEREIEEKAKELVIKKLIPVINYSLDSKIRFYEASLTFSKNDRIVRIAIYGKNYDEGFPDIMQINIELVSIFGKKFHIGEKNFYDFPIRVGNSFETYEKEISLEYEEFEEVAAVECELTGFYTDGESVLLKDEYQKTSLSLKQLKQLRKLPRPTYAIEYMEEFEDSWRCYCGKINSDIRCSYCGNVHSKGVDSDWINSANTATDLYNTILAHPEVLGDKLSMSSEIAQSLKYCIDAEKINGNQAEVAKNYLRDLLYGEQKSSETKNDYQNIMKSNYNKSLADSIEDIMKNTTKGKQLFDIKDDLERKGIRCELSDVVNAINYLIDEGIVLNTGGVYKYK